MASTNAYGQALLDPLSFNDVTTAARGAGFTGDGLNIIVAIAQAESGFIPNATNVNKDGSIDRGILQINDFWHPDVSTDCAFNPNCAFQQGYAISNGGKNFNAWASFTNGQYLKYIKNAKQGNNTQTVQQLLGTFYDPGNISQSYGVAELGNSANGIHSGVDYSEPLGTAIPSLSDGTVIDVVTGCPVVSGVGKGNANSCGGGFGNHPVILLSDGRTLIYGHMQSVVVNKGDTVVIGQTLGYVGMTGFTTGPHVHVELDRAGTTGGGSANSIDPTSFIKNAVASAPQTIAVNNPGSSAATGSSLFDSTLFNYLSFNLLATNFNQQMTYINGFDGLAIAIHRAETLYPFVWSNPIGSVVVNGRSIVVRMLFIIIGMVCIIMGVLWLVSSGTPQQIMQLGSGIGKLAGAGGEAAEGAALALPTEALAL